MQPHRLSRSLSAEPLQLSERSSTVIADFFFRNHSGICPALIRILHRCTNWARDYEAQYHWQTLPSGDIESKFATCFHYEELQ
jgi:hypothetical protein